MGLTVKELAGGLEFAGVGLEAVFELEAHLHAVAEVFRTLDAEAGGGVATVFHGERVFIDHGVVADGDFTGLVLETQVNLAVHRDVGGLNGESGSAENGDSDKRLLEHNLVIQIKGKIWESLLFAWLRGILGQEGGDSQEAPFSDDLRIQRIGLRDRASGRNAVITPMLLRKRNKRAESTLGPAFGGGRHSCATL